MKVKCAFCQSETNKVEKTEAIRIDEKNFHPLCAKKYQDKKELCDTICRIFKFKMPGPRNNAYISKFIGEGMTYKGMTNALVYFYDIKKNSIEKSNNGIGIIPWVYEEAQKYFENKTMGEKIRMEKVEQISEKFEEAEWETRKVRVQKTENPTQLIKTYDLSEIEW